VTTVAASLTEMAADQQLTADGLTYRVQKIHRLPDGGIVGACGDWPEAYPAIQWLLGGEAGEPPLFKDASLLVLRPDGTLWMADGHFPLYPLLNTYAAMGNGAQAAMVVMSCGLSAGEAVKAVSRLDAYTGEAVQLLKLEPQGKRKRLK